MAKEHMVVCEEYPEWRACRIALTHTMRVIAEMLVISVKTVEGHNSRIMAKVGAKNRAELVRYAIGAGLVRPEAPSRLA